MSALRLAGAFCCSLVYAVPVTTGLAAILVARVPPRALEGVHSHAH